MSGSDSRPRLDFTGVDKLVDRVKNYVECSIWNYKKKNETCNTLATQANIPPALTQTVWEKLEEDNPDFFRAYNARLILIDQITRFNRSLETQQQKLREVQQQIASTSKSKSKSC